MARPRNEAEAKIQANLGAVSLKKLGGSYALILPKVWVDLYALNYNGRRWVTLDGETAPGKLLLGGIDHGEVVDLLGDQNDALETE